MKREALFCRSAGQALLLLAGVALALGACDNAVNVSPTAPALPVIEPIGNRSLQITGSLTSEEPTCLAATVLYDGRELPGARVDCSDPAGCREIHLSARTSSESGRHTISFRVLDQSAEISDYRAWGAVQVARQGLGIGGVRIALGPEAARLQSGQSVTFELEFKD